jgi:hypothetical protein
MKYEYRFYNTKWNWTSTDQRQLEILENLNELGQLGWQVILYESDSNRYLLKRPTA